MVPSVEMVRFVNSGTEATMSAVRLARAATGRSRIVKTEGGYHGHGDGFLVSAGSGVATLGIAGSPGVPAEIAMLTVVIPYNDAPALEKAFECFPGEIAAFILEPIAANIGLVPPRPGYLEAVAEITRRQGALLIFDEVITGFRVAAGGAQKLYGVSPDLTTLGKILGGGLPVGAYGGRRDLMERMAPSGPVYQAGTLSGNPLAMSAGIAMLAADRSPSTVRGARGEGRAARRGRPKGDRGSRRVGQGELRADRLSLDALLRVGTVFGLRVGQEMRHGRLLPLLPRDAQARRLPAARAVRGLVRFHGPLALRPAPDREGRRREPGRRFAAGL